MRPLTILFTLIFLPVFFLPAQSRFSTTSFGAYSQKFVSPLSALENIAATHQIKGAQLEISAEKQLAIAELDCISAIIAKPAWGTVLSAGFIITGRELHRETNFGIGISRNIGRIGVGGRIFYDHRFARGYGGSGNPGIEAGAIFYLTDQLSMGFQVEKAASVNTSQGKPAFRISSGMGYEVSESVLLSVSITRLEHQPPEIKPSIIYRAEKSLTVLISFFTTTSSVAAFAGWTFQQYRVLAGISFHPELGSRPTAFFHYFQPP